MTVKGCRSFMGMVNFLTLFCSDLQKLLKPIHDLISEMRGNNKNLIVVKCCIHFPMCMLPSQVPFTRVHMMLIGPLQGGINT